MESRASLDSDRLYLGWQYARLYPDPGPPPKRPTPPEQHHVHPEWMDAQRREESRLNRPLMLVGALALGMAVIFGLLSWPLDAVPGWGAAVAIGVCLVLAGVAGYAVWQGEQALRVRLSEERNRLDRIRADRERRLHAAQEDHARRFDAWRERKAAYDAQDEWYGVTLPRGLRRLDVAGGTLSGWQALVTTMGASSMDAGHDVTVVDLSDGAVAGDLVESAAGRDPQVWVLPEDLPKLDLGAGLDAEAFCDVFSLLVNVSEERSTGRDLSVDNVILHRVLEVFGGRASIAQVTAALGALIQIGDPREDVERGLLTRDQLDRLGRIFGLGASDRVIYERVWALEAQLRKLASLGSRAASTRPSQLRVVSTAWQRGVLGDAVLGTYVITALLHELRRAPRRAPWSRLLFVCGADKLRGDVLDRLHEACEATGTRLVAMFGSLPAHVKERLGRGESAVAFMRMGNAEDAKFAAEHIGREQRFLLSPLTETVGAAVTEHGGGSYAGSLSTDDAAGEHAPETEESAGAGKSAAVGGTPAAAETTPAGAGHGSARAVELPWGGLEDSSWSSAADRDQATDELLNPAVMARTAWGRETARALNGGTSPPGPVQGSREFQVETYELQRLPAASFLLSYDAPTGRRIVCGDTNPAIVSLPRATRRELDEVGKEAAARSHDPPQQPQSQPPSQPLRPYGRPQPEPEGVPVADAEGIPGVATAASPYGPPSRRAQEAVRTRDRQGSAGESRQPGGDSGDSGDREVVAQQLRDRPGREQLTQLPPNLGPPPERLDWRRGR